MAQFECQYRSKGESNVKRPCTILLHDIYTVRVRPKVKHGRASREWADKRGATPDRGCTFRGADANEAHASSVWGPDRMLESHLIHKTSKRDPKTLDRCPRNPAAFVTGRGGTHAATPYGFIAHHPAHLNNHIWTPSSLKRGRKFSVNRN